MAGEFPTPYVRVTQLLVVSDLGRATAFYRDVLHMTDAGAGGRVIGVEVQGRARHVCQ
jgi:catechol-2,3-dioxygenase